LEKVHGMKLILDKAKTAKRLWSRVKKSKKCWIWLGHVTKNGYGQNTLITKYGGRICWKCKRGRYEELNKKRRAKRLAERLKKKDKQEQQLGRNECLNG
jgi:hypothetical protein